MEAPFVLQMADNVTLFCSNLHNTRIAQDVQPVGNTSKDAFNV